MSVEFQVGRVYKLMAAILVLFSLLILRLAWIQLLKGSWYASVATDYHSRVIYYHWGHGYEGRGQIVDRRGTAFSDAYLRPGAAVFTSVGRTYDDYEQWLSVLADYSGLDTEQIEERANRRLPIPLNRSLPQGLPHWIKQVTVQMDKEGKLARYDSTLAWHTVGFVTERFAEDRTPFRLVGRLGIEAAFDQLLRSPRPGVAAFVNARDRLIPGLGYRSTIDPNDLPQVKLTLDKDVQAIVEEVLDMYIGMNLLPQAGAVVVMDPNTGDILAMASRPLREGIDHQQNRALRKAPGLQLLPAASLVKVITTAAALESGFNPNTTYHCSGHITQGGNTFSCWQRHGHGTLNLAEALASSCNVYFAQAAQEVGAENLLDLANKLGLGRTFDLKLLPGEQDSGSLPTLADLATPGGITNHFALGSNKLEVTPLQMAVMVSAIANGGRRVEPRLVIETRNLQGRVERFPAVSPERVLRSGTARQVAAMMRGAVVHHHASYRPHQFPYAARELAVKTGTADVLEGVQVRWIGGFFPWQNPQYVLVYMGEVGRDGDHRALREQFLAELTERLARGR
jgi:cell division protein FtsI/penicillin-binding protein 2